MSSLLDILHRKDDRPAPDAGDVAWAAPDTGVELHLAVDNGAPGDPEPFTLAADPAPAQEPAPDPFATFAGPGGYSPDATRVLSTAYLRRRSRRNTAALGAGLGLILAASAAATWFMNEVRVDASDDSSLFVTPGPQPDTAAAVPAPPVENPPESQPVAIAPVATRRAEAAAEAPEDTAWYDLPASEEPLTAPELRAAEPIRIVRGTTVNPLFPKLTEAWAAFQAGDYARAELLYRDVHAADAGNVDALLGLAALAARGGRTDEARGLYQDTLLLEPTNATAISALSTLPPSGRQVLDESALKNLLRDQPGAANLHFALGLQYVRQGRWPDAQAAFFEAVRNEPGNADYAYNLAVSLDRLGQSGAAAAYYQRALDLATPSALFEPAGAAARLAALRNAAP